MVLATACTGPGPGAADPWPGQLVGRWTGEVGNGTYTEEWARMDDSTYAGAATMHQDGRVVSTEQVRLMRFAGSWVYLAATAPGRITSFVRIAADDRGWTFANPEHDFPRRIGYTVNGDTLRAWIDDGEAGDRRMDFRLVRVP
jgi:hypothetical protein